jgi:general secretion pathway protein K
VTSARAQRGVALIIALLVVALATVLIAGLLDRGELNAARVRNQLREAQAQAYAQGLEAYAARVLVQAQASDPGYDSNSSPWALPLPPTPVPGGEIVATMRDRNGCFNLNNLLDDGNQVSAVWQRKFVRLLQVLKLDVGLADAVTRWMRSAPMPDDGFYLQQDVPYRPAKQGFVHVSELRLIKGVTAAVYSQLAPEVCALPRGTPININTASVAVLMTLSDAVDEQMAKAIRQDGHAMYLTLDTVAQQLPGKIIDCASLPAQPCYDVHSSYFLARGDITLDGLPFTFYSLIERRTGGAVGGIRVIERSRGADL